MKYHGSFGGPQTLITSVTIKCNEFGEPDIVSIPDNFLLIDRLLKFRQRLLFFLTELLKILLVEFSNIEPLTPKGQKHLITISSLNHTLR